MKKENHIRVGKASLAMTILIMVSGFFILGFFSNSPEQHFCIYILFFAIFFYRVFINLKFIKLTDREIQIKKPWSKNVIEHQFKDIEKIVFNLIPSTGGLNHFTIHSKDGKEHRVFTGYYYFDQRKLVKTLERIEELDVYNYQILY